MESSAGLGVTTGNLVTAGQATALATISSFDPMYVYFSVPETTYLAFHKKYGRGRDPSSVPVELVTADGQTSPDRGPSISWTARRIRRPAPWAARAVPQSQALLRPGQFARVRFVLERRPNAVLVPKEAVTQTLTSKSVLMLDDAEQSQPPPIATDGEYGEYYIGGIGPVGRRADRRRGHAESPARDNRAAGSRKRRKGA